MLNTGGNNQDQRIQSPLGNLLTILKFWNLVVLGPVQFPTECLQTLPTNPTRNTMTRNTLPLTQFPHSAQHSLYQRTLVRLLGAESSLNPARARHMPPARRQSIVQGWSQRTMRRRKRRRDFSIFDGFFLFPFVLPHLSLIVYFECAERGRFWPNPTSVDCSVSCLDG